MTEATAEVIRLLKDEPHEGIKRMLNRLPDPNLNQTEKNQLFAAYHALGPVAKEAEPELLRWLSHKSPEMRRIGAGYFQSTGLRPLETEAVERLIACLKDNDSTVQRLAAMALGNATNHVSLVGPILLTQLRQPDPLVAGGAAIGIGGLRTAAAPLVPTLTNMLVSADVESRRQALSVVLHLTTLYSEVFVPLLDQNLSHQEATVRYAALDALRFYGKKATPAATNIIHCLSDPDSGVRLMAIQTLESLRLPARQTVGSISKALERYQTDGFLRIAARILGKQGKNAKEVVPQLEQLLGNTPDESVRNELFKALEKIQGKAAVKTLEEITESKAHQEAQKLLHAAEAGDAKAQFAWGEKLRAQGKDSYPEALRWFQRAAEQGLAEAQYEVGGAYYVGAGAPKDIATGLKWLELAAKGGVVSAQSDLGTIYLEGRHGVTKDTTVGLMWLNRASYRGDARAYYRLGLAYQKGDGVTIDQVEAYKWFHLGAEAGHPKAKEERAEMIGKLESQDLLEALRRANRFKPAP